VKGFLYGYNPVVWTAIGFQASGGIIVGLCVAYADTILKNFASLLSVLISGVASVYFFNFVITMHVYSLQLNDDLTIVPLWLKSRTFCNMVVFSARATSGSLTQVRGRT
jgi:hypothetical protein